VTIAAVEPVRVSSLVSGSGVAESDPEARTLTFEAGLLAPQADGAVVVSMGETSVLVTAVAARSVREGVDFFPLTIDVEERMYAAGKIPGSFFRREGRPSEQAILVCRLTDRPLRPAFPDGFRNETQVVATILGVDFENPYDVSVINGASAALTLSGLPFEGPIGAVRLAHHEGRWLAHPTYDERAESTFEIVVAGRRTDAGDIAIMMVEAGGTEAAWDLFEGGAPKVTEEVVAEGLEFSKGPIGQSIDLQLQLRAEYEKLHGTIEPIAYTAGNDYGDDVGAAVQASVGADLAEALAIADKADRNARIDELGASAAAELVGTSDAPGRFADRAKEVKAAYRSLQKSIVRTRIVHEGVRIDGRGPRDLRPVSSRVGIINTAHGSGLFQRGETQVLSVTTLGMPKMEQMLDTIGGDTSKRYMHHYNMPPYSTGETGRVGSPKRREIGHGALAEKALTPVIPTAEEFPYTLRVVSDVLSSNGSTSMGSVCGSTLSLMDAGVPIKAPVAGIAMGLVYHEGKYTALTDILGAEDAFGDMDFKVAGTADFVTALQLDTKIDGIPADVLAQALAQAKEARMAILDVMLEAISRPRSEVRDTAPKIVSFEVPGDKVGEIIGPKGKTIRAIEQETGAEVSVDGDGPVGTVTVGARDNAQMEAARRMIDAIINPPQAEVGALYQGTVVNITKFGAFVNILPGRDGLIHISKLGGGRRIDRVEDVLSLGDVLEVKVDDIDPNGKLSLSLAGDAPEGGGGGGGGGYEVLSRVPRAERADDAGAEPSADADRVSFEDSWDGEARELYGDLGPAEERGGGGGDRGDRGDRDRRPPRRRRR
jgi:polyribonucleotide nucleotidyltransferase